MDESPDFFLEQLIAGCKQYLKRLYFLRDEVTAGRREEPSISFLETRISTCLLFMKDLSQ